VDMLKEHDQVPHWDDPEMLATLIEDQTSCANDRFSMAHHWRKTPRANNDVAPTHGVLLASPTMTPWPSARKLA
jgi:hypothetical protein